jgi:hypothetical protein
MLVLEKTRTQAAEGAAAAAAAADAACDSPPKKHLPHLRIFSQTLANLSYLFID